VKDGDGVTGMEARDDGRRRQKLKKGTRGSSRREEEEEEEEEKGKEERDGERRAGRHDDGGLRRWSLSHSQQSRIEPQFQFTALHQNGQYSTLASPTNWANSKAGWFTVCQPPSSLVTWGGYQ
jgi:hypothetical protein